MPTAIWIALGVLSMLALALAGRTYVERRRARALARDREQLIGDVAALERALLPAVPDRLGAVAISVAYRSCDGPAAGGDFYDAFELPGGRAAVIVGDISGHGPDALEGTNSVRAQLHALLETGMTPRAAIAMVGEHAPVQLAGRFSTVVVAVHDPTDSTLTFATAGHAPPVVAGPGAEELLSAGASPPIGVELRTGLRETTVTLPPGTTCCFYTDGIVEAKNGVGMIGRGRLEELVSELDPDEQAPVLLERVIAEAHDASDDMTLCLIRPLYGAATRSPRIEVLELDPDDVDSGFAARFLDACGVPPDDLPATVELAHEIVSTGRLGAPPGGDRRRCGAGRAWLPRPAGGRAAHRRLAERERVGLRARREREREPVLTRPRQPHQLVEPVAAHAHGPVRAAVELARARRAPRRARRAPGTPGSPRSSGGCAPRSPPRWRASRRSASGPRRRDAPAAAPRSRRPRAGSRACPSRSAPFRKRCGALGAEIGLGRLHPVGRGDPGARPSRRGRPSPASASSDADRALGPAYSPSPKCT